MKYPLPEALSFQWLGQAGFAFRAGESFFLMIPIFLIHSTPSIVARGFPTRVHEAILRIARSVRKTPYNVDKLFWLIGSGNFYDDSHIGKKGKIGSLKKGFISYAQRHLI